MTCNLKIQLKIHFQALMNIHSYHSVFYDSNHVLSDSMMSFYLLMMQTWAGERMSAPIHTLQLNIIHLKRKFHLSEIAQKASKAETISRDVKWVEGILEREGKDSGKHIISRWIALHFIFFSFHSLFTLDL